MFDRVLVERAAPVKKTVGGIYLPETVQQKMQHAIVVEGLSLENVSEIWLKSITVGTGRVGDDGKPVPLVVKKGDVVMLNSWGGNTVKVNEKELLVVQEHEILGNLVKNCQSITDVLGLVELDKE